MKILFKLGGVSSLLQALLYVITVVSLYFVPVEQITGDMAQLVSSFSLNSLPLTVMSLSFVFLGFLGVVAVVPATAAMLGNKDDGWIVFGRNVALLCLSVITVYYVWFLSFLSGLSDLTILSANPHAPMNWVSWFMFGGMGLWVVVVGSLSWKRKLMPRGFVAFCAIKTIGFWVILAGVIFGNILVCKVGAVLGGLIGGFAYHTWLGINLIKRQLHE